MNSQILSELTDLYRKYTLEFKPQLAFVESFKGKFPGPILNEIRAFNDHISRCFMDGVSDEDALREINKANGHLTRANLDCFKALLIAYEYRYTEFKDSYKDVNLAVVNDGAFLPKLRNLHQIAQMQAVMARRTESMSFPDKEEAYLEYKRAIIAYECIEEYINESEFALANALVYAKNESGKRSRENWKFAIISAVIGVVLGYILNSLM